MSSSPNGRIWKELKATDSATCRSRHSFDAMDIASQSESARNA
ncbi:NapC/NirT family cytochrome c [Shigella sonnei]